MIIAISEAFKYTLQYDKPLHEAIVDNVAVRLGSYSLIANSTQDAQKICKAINNLLKNQFKEMKSFLKSKQTLQEESTAIKTAFKRIQNDIRAGLPLKGHGSAGRTAGYE